MHLDELKKKRQEGGYTQKQLASEVGIGRSTLSLIENGQRKPSYEVMEKMAKVLKEPIEIT